MRMQQLFLALGLGLLPAHVYALSFQIKHNISGQQKLVLKPALKTDADLVFQAGSALQIQIHNDNKVRTYFWNDKPLLQTAYQNQKLRLSYWPSPLMYVQPRHTYIDMEQVTPMFINIKIAWGLGLLPGITSITVE